MVKHGGEIWARHPHVRSGSQLTFGERAADILKNVMGTWSALGLIIAVIVFWLLAIHDPGELHLNLGLSFVASIQGVVLQIAANRIDRTNAESQAHHAETTDQIGQLLDENTVLTRNLQHLHDDLDALAVVVRAAMPSAPPPAGPPVEVRSAPAPAPVAPRPRTRKPAAGQPYSPVTGPDEPTTPPPGRASASSGENT